MGPDSFQMRSVPLVGADVVRAPFASKLELTGIAFTAIPLLTSWFAGAIDPNHPVKLALKHGLGPFLAFLVGPALVVAGLWLRARRRPAPGNLSLAEGSLYLETGGSSRSIPLSEVASAVLVPTGGARLELRLRGGDLVRATVGYDQLPALEELLAAAKLTPAQRRAELHTRPLASIPGRAYGCFVVLLFLVVPLLKAAFPNLRDTIGILGSMLVQGTTMAALLGAAWVLAALSVGRGVVVGTDGFTVPHSLRGWRFIPYERVVSLALDQGAPVAKLTDGSSVRLGRSGWSDYGPALLRHLERARSATTTTPETTARLVSLDRMGRTLEAWRESLRAVVDTAANPRAAGVERAELLRVLDDPDAPAERRLGAALALDPGRDPDAATRVRVAAESCANERVRVALSKLADGALDDATLDAATTTDARAKG